MSERSFSPPLSPCSLLPSIRMSTYELPRPFICKCEPISFSLKANEAVRPPRISSILLPAYCRNCLPLMTSVCTGASFSRCWVPVPVTTTSCKLSARNTSFCADTPIANSQQPIANTIFFIIPNFPQRISLYARTYNIILAGLLTFLSLFYLPDYTVSGVIRTSLLNEDYSSRYCSGFSPDSLTSGTIRVPDCLTANIVTTQPNVPARWHSQLRYLPFSSAKLRKYERKAKGKQTFLWLY